MDDIDERQLDEGEIRKIGFARGSLKLLRISFVNERAKYQAFQYNFWVTMIIVFQVSY